MKVRSKTGGSTGSRGRKTTARPRQLKTAAEFKGALEQIYSIAPHHLSDFTMSAFKRLPTRQQTSVIQGKRCLAVTFKKASKDTCLGVRKLLGELGLPGFVAIEIALSASLLGDDSMELDRHLLVGSYGMTERFAAELEKLIGRFGGGSVYDLACRESPRTASDAVPAEFLRMLKSARTGWGAKRGRTAGKPRPKANRQR